MSSKDLYGIISAIVEHWELQGVRKAKKPKITTTTVIQVICMDLNGNKRCIHTGNTSTER
jgi:hypothetical protein